VYGSKSSEDVVSRKTQIEKENVCMTNEAQPGAMHIVHALTRRFVEVRVEMRCQLPACRGMSTSTSNASKASSISPESTSGGKFATSCLHVIFTLQTFLSLECPDVTGTTSPEIPDVKTETFHMLFDLIAYAWVTDSAMHGTFGALKNAILVRRRGHVVGSPNIFVVVGDGRRSVYSGG